MNRLKAEICQQLSQILHADGYRPKLVKYVFKNNYGLHNRVSTLLSSIPVHPVNCQLLPAGTLVAICQNAVPKTFFDKIRWVDTSPALRLIDQRGALTKSAAICFLLMALPLR